jgi:hypothetical protein
VKGEERSFFIIGQGTRDPSSTILRQSGVIYRWIPPSPHFVTFRDAQVFSHRVATPTITKVYGQVRVLCPESLQLTGNDLLISHVLYTKHQNSLILA